MFLKHRQFRALPDRGPLKVLFVITSMPVGGAETLLVNLIRRLDRARFCPELCCLKAPGPLGEQLRREIPTHCGLLKNKFDVRVFGRLVSLIRKRKIDALITVGAGDKMFWGRLAARFEGLPVTLSALHSTGWPDTISRLNRMLTPITDAFIAVASEHARYLVEHERLPRNKVRAISNGVDVERFRPCAVTRSQVRRTLGVSDEVPVCGIVAALRPEKNHSLFLQAASILRNQLPQTRFLIVGDGPERMQLEQQAAATGLSEHVHFLGSRDDVERMLAAMDLFALTSHNEANPVSILEAMAMKLPVVATRVGSVSETVHHDDTGFLTTPGDAEQIAMYWRQLLENPKRAHQMGSAGRELVKKHWSLTGMVEAYQTLIEEIYEDRYPSDATPSSARETNRCSVVSDQ